MNPVCLNLGCGRRPRDGFVNVDLYGEPDQRVDLRAFPWPWDDESVDAIYSRGYFEHAPEFMKTFRESHRILRPGGTITLIVPHHRCPQHPWPEQHLHQFSTWTFTHHLHDPAQYCGGRTLFETLSIRHFFGPRLRVLSPLANLNPLAWEWLGLPVAEIEWVGVRV